MNETLFLYSHSYFMYEDWDVDLYYDLYFELDLNDEKMDVTQNQAETKLMSAKPPGTKARIELLERYFEKENKLPSRGDIFEGVNVGNIIHDVKAGSCKWLLNDVRRIFGDKFEIKPYKSTSVTKSKIEACKEFYQLFQRVPGLNTIYKDIHIGKFYDYVRKCNYKPLKAELIDIFGPLRKIKNE